jgi:hypothetical protein
VILSPDEQYLVKSLVNGPHGFKRSLPKRDALQKNLDLAQYLKEVLILGKSEDKVEFNEALRLCYRMGWLQAEMLSDDRKVYMLPSKLHERYEFSNDYFSRNMLRLSCRYVEILLNKSAPEFPLHKFPSVRELSFFAVRKFSRTLLSSRGRERGFGAGAEERPVRRNIDMSLPGLATSYSTVTCILLQSGIARFLMVG